MASQQSQASQQMGFYFDATRCTGCKTCVLACKDYNDLDAQAAYRQVYEYGDGGWERGADGTWSHSVAVYYVSLACNHCDAPVCVQVCPTGAMHKDDLGLVRVNAGRCIGCGYCEMSCPYRAPRVDRDLGHSTKCDGCRSRLDEGRGPICAEACPTRAIEFGPVADLRAAYGAAADLAPLPPSEATRPNLVLRLPRCVDAEGRLPGGDGRVINTIDIV